MTTIIESVGAWGVRHTRPHAASRLSTPHPGDWVDTSANAHLYPFNAERHGNYGMIEALDKYGTGKIHICMAGGISAFLLEDGSVSISGGPWAMIEPDWLQAMLTCRVSGVYWNWGNNSRGAGRGVNYHIARPVFRLLPLEEYGQDRKLRLKKEA